MAQKKEVTDFERENQGKAFLGDWMRCRSRTSDKRGTGSGGYLHRRSGVSDKTEKTFNREERSKGGEKISDRDSAYAAPERQGRVLC